MARISILIAAKIWTPPSLWSLAALAFVVIVGIPILISLRREAQEHTLTDDELLDQFQKAYETGEMEEAEFHRVRAMLGERITQGGRDAPPGPVKTSPISDLDEPASSNDLA